MSSSRLSSVAVIGAGLAGLSLARRLTSAGVAVTVYDKGRVPGGRVATRRTDFGRLDHGAQYFTARDPAFVGLARGWEEAGVIARWQGHLVTLSGGRVDPAPTEERWVGVGGMSTIGRHLAEGLDVRTGVRIVRTERHTEGWILETEQERVGKGFDTLVVAVPPAQAVPLLGASPTLTALAASARMSPCWAVLLGFEAPLEVGFDGAFVSEGPLAWVARDASKPGRGGGETWVLHASPEWSQAQVELPADAVHEPLVAAFASLLAPLRVVPTAWQAHRWLYARPIEPLAAGRPFDTEAALAVCGDWCRGPRIEAACLSGLALADQLLAGEP